MEYIRHQYQSYFVEAMQLHQVLYSARLYYLDHQKLVKNK